ncbi:MAG: T9SS type A sorting domain-containing protein, partial [Bacteroidales bacterium]|nr:T9SS type A sorting domain-containing protein [Bacteroidales bacterium]
VTVKHNTATLIRPADITVVDLTGRIIYYQFMNIDNNSFELNLAGNSSGLYTIIIRNKAFSHQAKVSLLQ